jgi:hypothetical protein
MSCFKRRQAVVLLFFFLTGVCWASKQTEAELRRALAQAQSQLSQANKEKAGLQEALKTAAVAQAQLAGALRENARMQASIEALEARNRISQQEAVRTAAKDAADSAAQRAAKDAVKDATQQAAKNAAEMKRALAKVSEGDKRRARLAQQDREEQAAANEANAEETHKALSQQEIANAQSLMMITAARLQLEELKRSSESRGSVMYVGALGAVVSFFTLLAKIYMDGRRHKWATAVTASTVAETTRTAVREELQKTPEACAPPH